MRFRLFVAAATAAVGRMRDTGFDRVLVVDAPNCGQDRQFVMPYNGNPGILASRDNSTNTGPTPACTAG